MKRLLFVVLMMICSVSWAEWDVTWVNPSNGDIYHHDKSTIQKEGDLRKMWTSQQYIEPIDVGLGPLSMMKSQFHYDCKKQLVRMIAIVGYSYDGTVQFSKVLNKEWVPTTPGTPMMMDWKIACGKK